MPSGAPRSLRRIDRGFRRTLFGYRPSEVERALADADSQAGRYAESSRAHEARAAELADTVAELRREAADRERRLTRLDAELGLVRSHAEHQLRGLAAIGAEIDELRVTARGQATRIRLEALREAAAVSEQAGKARGDEGDPGADLLRAVERAVERVAAEWGEEPAASEPRRSLAAVPEVAAIDPELLPPDLPGEPRITRASGAEADAEAIEAERELRINVDVGPFRDFSQLVRFEDAATEIPATREITIRRFSEGRASIEVLLAEPIDLLAELERCCDLDFTARSNEDTRLVLDVAA
jgi:hypothetical protein